MVTIGVLDIGKSFQPMEYPLQEAFLPALFKVATSHIPGRVVTGLPVNQAAIALPYNTQKPGSNWTAYCVITVHPIAALCGKV